jgi:hypothetical protein
MILHDDHQTTSTERQYCNTALEQHDTIVSRLPLVYKRRRRPPKPWDETNTQQLARSHSLTLLILASASIT